MTLKLEIQLPDNTLRDITISEAILYVVRLKGQARVNRRYLPEVLALASVGKLRMEQVLFT